MAWFTSMVTVSLGYNMVSPKADKSLLSITWLTSKLTGQLLFSMTWFTSKVTVSLVIDMANLKADKSLSSITWLTSKLTG